MKTETVIIQVNRLYDNYNENIPQDIRSAKINLLNRELSIVNDQAFIAAVDEIIRDENIKKFPTLAQIRNHLPKQQNYNTRQQLQDCDHCRDGVTPVWIFKEGMGNNLEFKNGQISKGEQKRQGKYYQFSYSCPFCEAGKHEQQQGTPALPIEYHSIPYEQLRQIPKINLALSQK